MFSKILSLFSALIFATTICAQTTPEAPKAEYASKSKGVLAHFTLGGHQPGGDLQKRFGLNGSIGAGAEFVTSNDWFVGLEGAFIFGSKVKEDPLSILRTPEGDIIGNDRTLATVRLQERGMYLGATLGKLFTFGEHRRGLRVTLGGGWEQHRIRALDDARTVAQLTGDYKKGFDRLCGGPALQQFVGWQHVGRGRDMSWMVGLEFNQAFTHTLRDWDFSAMKKIDEQRLDLRFGIKLAWTLPFYIGNAEEVYY